MKKLLFIAAFYLIVILSNRVTILAQDNLFRTGQDAEVILGPYSTYSNASGLHHPSRAMSDGTKLYVADTRNNRILIWNTAPTENNQAADVVVGQPDFLTNNSGAGATGLNWPVGVFSDGTRLFVTDTENNRVLIWNQIPTANGEPADLVLGQSDFDTVVARLVNACSIHWPWDVFCDGTRLYVVCTGSGRVLIWNSVPTQNNQPADMVLGKKDLTTGFSQELNAWCMSTPRAVATDGTRLAVSDYNFKRILVWNTIPSQNGQEADLVLLQDDFTSMEHPSVDFGHGGLWMSNGKLFLAGNFAVYVWDQFPSENNQSPDRMIGESGFSRGSGLWGVSYDGKRLYAADSNGARVLIYQQLPSDSGASADLVLGQPDFETNIFLGRSGIRSNRSVVSTGRKLLISGFDSRIVIQQDIPDTDEAEADNFIGRIDFDGRTTSFDIGEVAMWSDGIRLCALSRQYGLYMWDDIPTEDNVLPDRILFQNSTFRNLPLNEPQGLALNEKQLFISDTENRRILIWNSIPEEGESQEPDVVINVNSEPYSISTDGQRLAVAGFTSGILLWNSIPTKDDQNPDIVLEGHPERFNIPQGVFIFDGKLYVADTGFDRVAVYNTFPMYDDQQYDAVLGQQDLISTIAGKARNKLNMPWSLWFDGEYLWVAEFKFADRVLGYKANIELEPPASPSDLQAYPVSNYQIDIRWKDNAYNEKGFIIKYKESNSPDYDIYGYLSANASFCQITGLDKNTRYDFIVIAFNCYEESPASGPVEAATLNLSNSPPFEPSDPLPEDEYVGVIENKIELQWEGGDPDASDAVTYDLYFGTAPNPPIYSQDLKQNSYNDNIHQLAGKTVYNWKIVAEDMSGSITEGPVWCFTSASLPGPGYDLTISSGSGGTTNPYPDTYSYNMGAPVLVYAIPDTGYYFSGWTGDVPYDSRSDNPLDFVINSNTLVSANFSLTGVEEKRNFNFPKCFIVYNNYPNPFNSTTKIRYDLPKRCFVKITVLNVLGQQIRSLISEFKNTGRYEVVWDGFDDHSQAVDSGLYFFKIDALDFNKIRKAVLLK